MSDPSSQRLPRRFILTGFMGSGKTTVGRLLAAQLGWSFIDLDTAVEQRTGKTVPQIFTEEGEESFRATEALVLEELLQQPETVIALGGGAPTMAAVRALLAGDQGALVLHLHAPFPILYERCMTQARDPRSTSRPLLMKAADAQERYSHRLPIYVAVAHFTVDIAGLEAQQVVTDIVRNTPKWRQSAI